MTAATSTARFIVRGARPVNIEVEGRLDAGAAVGFDVVAGSFDGHPEVVLDLRACSGVDDAARGVIDRAVARIRDRGGDVRVIGGDFASHQP